MGSYVFAGAPCSGKTAVIDEIARRGYCIVPEAARELIAEEKARRDGDTPERRPYEFRKKLVARQAALEESIIGDPRFLDTCMIDNALYAEWYLGEQGKEFAHLMTEYSYDGIFLFDTVPFTKDDVRFQTAEEQFAIHEMLGRKYVALGYNPIHVPVMDGPKKEALIRRADFVLSHVQSLRQFP